jgi:CHAD domain-containing protein
MAELTLHTRTVAVLDDEEKTTVRVRLESGTCRDPMRDLEHALDPVARVVPVRGYDRERERVEKLLAEDCGLARVSGSELAQALERFGREPGDYSSKFRLELNPAMPAADAARAIHLSLLGTMLRNEEGTRKDLDSEFLHDFRVAIRRTRSALTQVREVYPPEVVERFKEEFRWLGSETGPLRDLDVWLLKIGAYRGELPEEAREDLTPLGDYLAKAQRTAHRRLVEALDTERYRRLVSDWRAFLTTRPEDSGPGPGNAKRPILSVASERIWRVYRGVVKRGGRIDDAAPAAALHDVRIRAKKLRYLLEFFRSLYPEDAVGRLVSELKKLQDNLGDFNDYQVQRESLERYAAEMAAADGAPVRTHLAMGRLLDRLDAGQAAERRRFRKRFSRFASPENHETFERLFGWRSAP